MTSLSPTFTNTYLTHGAPGSTRLLGLTTGVLISELHSIRRTDFFSIQLKKFKFRKELGIGRIAGSFLHRDHKEVFQSSTTTLDNPFWEFEVPVIMSKLSLIHNDKNDLVDC